MAANEIVGHGTLVKMLDPAEPGLGKPFSKTKPHRAARRPQSGRAGDKYIWRESFYTDFSWTSTPQRLNLQIFDFTDPVEIMYILPFELHTCHKTLTIAKTLLFSLLQTVWSSKWGGFLVPKNGSNLEVRASSESSFSSYSPCSQLFWETAKKASPRL